jgi:hypothetical protein
MLLASGQRMLKLQMLEQSKKDAELFLRLD